MQLMIPNAASYIKGEEKETMPLPGPCPNLMQPWYEEMEEDPGH